MVSRLDRNTSATREAEGWFCKLRPFDESAFQQNFVYDKNCYCLHQKFKDPILKLHGAKVVIVYFYN